MNNDDHEGYGPYAYRNVDPEETRPSCAACGDPVKVVHHSGIPKYAAHCRECYAELRWGKIPVGRGRRRPI